MKNIFGIVALGGVALVLQGCGSSSSNGTTTTTTTASVDTTTKIDTTTTKVATTTTTTKVDTTTKSTTSAPPTPPPPTPAPTPAPPPGPMSSQQAADYLNYLYTAFNETDDTSTIGATITMLASAQSFFGNIFCSHFWNPKFNGVGGCSGGRADCRLSTSVMNNRWMIKRSTKALAAFGGRQVGLAFNQSMVESKWARCSYIWDGATNNLYNRGCGVGAPSTSCDAGADSAFNNQCGGHTCTPDDDKVKRQVCDVAGGRVPVPPTHAGHVECLFPGPAFGYTGQADYKPYKSYTHEMAKQRLKYNDGKDFEGDNLEKNNEIVIDEELLMKDVKENPAAAIPAVLYIKTDNAANTHMYKQFATKVRDELCNYFKCKETKGGDIPLVAVDIQNYLPGGPFLADAANDELSVMV